MSLHFINLLNPDLAGLPEAIRTNEFSIPIASKMRDNIVAGSHEWFPKLEEWCEENMSEDCFILHTPGGMIMTLQNEADYLAFRLSWA